MNRIRRAEVWFRHMVSPLGKRMFHSVTCNESIETYMDVDVDDEG